MDLRVTVVGMPPCATEFHFCNIAGAFAARVALTETLFGCHAALRCGREALFLRPTMLFFFPMPAPDCRRGSAPVRRPEFPPPMDSAPCW